MRFNNETIANSSSNYIKNAVPEYSAKDIESMIVNLQSESGMSQTQFNILFLGRWLLPDLYIVVLKYCYKLNLRKLIKCE